jgi:hypothetical protein
VETASFHGEYKDLGLVIFGFMESVWRLGGPLASRSQEQDETCSITL